MLEFDLPPLFDPEGFVEVIRRAERITSFYMSFNPPNPLDAEEHFERPMQKLLEAAGGKKGNVAIWGHNLKSEPLVDLSRAAARAGNPAKASVHLPDEPKEQWRSTSKEPVRIPVDDSGSLRERMLDEYRRIGASAEHDE